MLIFLISVLVVKFCFINEIECLTAIQDLLPGYYDGDTVQQFKRDWRKYQHAFENAIETGLQEDFGTRAVNIYERNRQNSHVVGSGFTITDGVVRVYLYELVLRQIPSLLRPRLELNLPSNHGKFSSRLDRVFIDSTYYVARNKSAVIFARPEDQKSMSPFSLQQVDRLGNVTIIADDCLLSGISIMTLSGDSVHLGHTPVRVTDCKFTVEISTHNSGAPPVIAPYFAQDAKQKIELMMTKPIREELQTKLQGALYSYINTSVLFGAENMHKFRKSQKDLFKSYAKFMVDYVSNVNMKTLKANRGTVKLKGFDVVTDVSPGVKGAGSCQLSLKDLKLHGLETAYVARSGGPYSDDRSTTATEAIVFSSMQIHGTGVHKDKSGNKENTIAAEIRDIAVSLTMSIEKTETKIVDMHLMGWRSSEFSIRGWCLNPQERVGYQSLVYGHILNELPVRVINHLTSILGGLPDDGNENLDGKSSEEKKDNNEENATVSSPENSEASDTKTAKEYKRDKKGFFSDDFFSDVDNKFLSDDNIKEKFFSDDNIKEKFFSDDNIKEQFFSDDNIKENFFSDKMDENFLSDIKDSANDEKSDINFSHTKENDNSDSEGSDTDKRTSNSSSGKDDKKNQDGSDADVKQRGNDNKGNVEETDSDNDNIGHDDSDVDSINDDDKNGNVPIVVDGQKYILDKRQGRIIYNSSNLVQSEEENN